MGHPRGGLLRPGVQPDAAAELRVCPACHETLRHLYDEHLHWMREIRFYQEGG
jgi:hypothetical protein